MFIAKAVAFCIKVVLTSPSINHFPNLLVLQIHIETTSLVGFLGVSPYSAKMFTHLQKRNEEAYLAAQGSLRSNKH